jgi:cytochrome d ubiquinol oxidase subunit II
MLIGIVLRGVAFDFRVKARDKHKSMWNRLFSIGSLAAASAQGWMLGSFLTGFGHSGWKLVFSAFVALTLPTAYSMLGAGWLIMKTEGELQQKAVRWASRVLWPMGATLAGISLASPLVSQTVFEKWFALPQFFALLPVPVACAASFFAAWHVLGRRELVAAGHGWVVFASTVLIFVLAFFGLAYSLYPFIVIDRMTVWQAAADTKSLEFILVGVAITLPAIVGYTVFMYRVFRGKATTLNY